MKKIIVILGPTATGKTEWGIKLAKKFKSEVISADSRTVYKYLDIGTAKPKGEKCRRHKDLGCWMIEGVLHYLLDFKDPLKESYSVADFHKNIKKCLNLIYKKDKTPIIVGGSPLYLYSFLRGYSLGKLGKKKRAIKKVREELKGKKSTQLFEILERLDPKYAKIVDRRNKRRLQRALEVCLVYGKKFSQIQNHSPVPYSILKIGIKRTRKEIYKRIDERTETWFKAGFMKEIKKLRSIGIGPNKLKEFGLGYKEAARYLVGEIKSTPELKERINFCQHAYVRRQMNWFKKDKEIKWCQNIHQAEELVKFFLST